MSAPTNSQEITFPHSTLSVNETTDSRTSLSDDEVIPDEDSSEITKLLVERLRALKHVCGYVEHYVTAIARAQKSQSNSYEKVLKTASEPIRELHHLSQGTGGVGDLFDNIRANTQGMINMHIETERTLKGSVLPVLERLHKEIKAKAKEMQGPSSKKAKQVDSARAATQKHIEMLGQQVALFYSAAGNKTEQASDPYVLRRGITHRLNKQINEENNSRQDILVMQNSFREFEAHVMRTIQGSMDRFFQVVGAQTDREHAMYADIFSTANNIPTDFEWSSFYTNNREILVDPAAVPRSLETISFPNIDHRATKPLIEGTLERKSRGVFRGYSTAYFVVTAALFLHQFSDDDDFYHDPVPELTLYLPDCILGGVYGVEFRVKGKDVSGGMVGNAFHITHDLSFKAHTPADADKWWNTIRSTASGHSGSSIGGSHTAAGSAPADGADGGPAKTNGRSETRMVISRSGSHYHKGPGDLGTDKA